jgi:hypothetical protein
MRYKLNQKIWTIGLTLVNKESNKPVYPYGFLRPYPNQFDITNIFFNELTVTEHHKVSGEWSDEKQYDGFILKDTQDRVWHNQYPRASYGQLSDSNDGLFTTPLFEKLFEETKALDNDLDWNTACTKFMDQYKSTINQFSLTRFMEDLNGGIVDDDTTKVECHEIWPKIEEIQKRVIQTFKETTGKTLEHYIEHFGVEGDTIRFRRWRVVE